MAFKSYPVTSGDPQNLEDDIGMQSQIRPGTLQNYMILQDCTSYIKLRL